MQSTINKLIERKNLSQPEAQNFMSAIMSGQVTAAQIGGFITALRMKGETPEEITGCAMAMRDKAETISCGTSTIDTCGTGGDHLSTFNISTTVSFVLAGGGLPVAKHGNRSVSSRSGSADVLESLGVNVNLSPQQVESCFQKTGISFLFAPTFHKAMKYAVGPRRELGFRSIFNLLGPLTNPAGAQYQLIGVYDKKLTDTLARALLNIGVERAMVVHGTDGMDEITLTGISYVSEVRNNTVMSYQIDPSTFGLKHCSPQELKGGTAEENAVITRRILSGEEKGPKRDIVLLNAAAAFYVAGKVFTLQEGVILAAEVLKKGAGEIMLDKLISVSQSLPGQEQPGVAYV